MVSGKLEVFTDSILLDIHQARSTLESISLKMIIGSNLLIQDAGWAYESIRRLKQKRRIMKMKSKRLTLNGLIIVKQ